MSETHETPTVKRYSLKRKTIPLELEMEDGTIGQFTMVELIGSERDKFLSKQISRGTDVKGKEKRPEIQGACSDLLTLCMRDPQNQPVPAAQIDNWPSDMQTQLYLDAYHLSGLDRKMAQDEAKNV